MSVPIAVISVLVSLVYQTVFLTTRGATPGKMVVGTVVRRVGGPGKLTVVDALKRQLIDIATTIGSLVPLLGLFAPVVRFLDPAWLLWDPKRQCLHDKVADTVVVLATRTADGRSQRAGSTVPTHSPRPMTLPSGPGAVARRVMVSPSSRKVRWVPSSRVSGSVPLQVSSRKQPRVPFSGPEIVPDPKRSPSRRVAPLTVMCATIWAGDQYRSRDCGRETTVPFQSTSRCRSSP